MNHPQGGHRRERDDGGDDERSGAGEDVTAGLRDEADAAASDDAGSSEQIPPEKRHKRKAKDRHRCRACGAAGPGAGGVAKLNVHHADPDPEHCDLHNMRNLLTLCVNCHSWIHKQPSASDVSISLSEADQRHLRPYDYDILRFLYREGPAMASDVTAALTADVTEVAVRERLWLLMGLDRMVESRDKQVVDRDAETGEWGPPDEIAQSVRGRVPRDVQTLMQRVEDELVRQALDRGCDRDVVADVLDIHERTTWIKERRAYACAFPLNALTNGDDAARVVGECSGDREGVSPAGQ